MCGIAGIFSDTTTTFDSNRLKKMSTLLQHRGPDAEGFFLDQHLALVHRRLKIIDLSDQANQPMQSDEHVLVFNGEIYNYPALRKQLEKSGCVFKTSSDTEVLMQGLARFEEGFISQLEGDFAFCFYNKKSRRVLLARDRFGVKPLYFSRHENKLFFSSEIKPLLAAGVPRVMNRSVIREYFQYRYVGRHDTLFAGIEHFPPGHFLKINGSQQSLVPYFRSDMPPSTEKISFQQAFENSVAGRLLSDRPLNLLLSGGIDSSAIAAQINALGHKTSTLTYSFNTKDGALDEYEAAKKLALSLQFTPRQIKEGKSDFSRYPEIIKSLEEPIGDSIILANSHLFYEAKKRSTVLLSGEGADELFSGYAHHRVAQLIRLIKKVYLLPVLVGFLVRLIPLGLLDRLSFYPARLNQPLKERIIAALNSRTETELFSQLASLFTNSELDQLLINHNFQRKELFNDSFFLTDFTNWLPRYGLMRIDKLSMAYSLEVRVPFLSHILVQAAQKEGFHQNAFWGQDKSVFRHFCKNVLKLSNDIVNKRKQPFFNPEIENLNHEYLKYMQNILTPERVGSFKIVNYEFVSGLMKNEKPDFLTLKKLNCILIFQIWCETFFTLDRPDLT